MSRIIEIETLRFCPSCGLDRPDVCELLGHFYPCPPSPPFRVSAIIEGTLPDTAPVPIDTHPGTGAHTFPTVPQPTAIPGHTCRPHCSCCDCDYCYPLHDSILIPND